MLQHKITIYPQRSLSHALHSYEAFRWDFFDQGASKYTPDPYIRYNRSTRQLTYDLCPMLTRDEAYTKIQKFLPKPEDLDLIPDDTTYKDLPVRNTDPKGIKTLTAHALTSYADLISDYVVDDILPENCVFITIKEKEIVASTKVNPIKNCNLDGDSAEDPKRTNSRISEMCDIVDKYHPNIVSVCFLERGIFSKEVHAHILVMYIGTGKKPLFGSVAMSQMISYLEDEWCRINGLRSKEFRKKGFHAKRIESTEHLLNCVKYPFSPDKANYRLEGLGYGKRIRPRGWSKLTRANKETDKLTAAQFMYVLEYLRKHTRSKGMRHLGRGRMSLKDRRLYDRAINYGIARGNECYGEDLSIVGGAPVLTFWDRGLNPIILPKSQSVTLPDGSVEYYLEGYSDQYIKRRRAEVNLPERTTFARESTIMHGCVNEESSVQHPRVVKRIAIENRLNAQTQNRFISQSWNQKFKQYLPKQRE